MLSIEKFQAYIFISVTCALASVFGLPYYWRRMRLNPREVKVLNKPREGESLSSVTKHLLIIFCVPGT